jgi:hypothetical protein
MANQNFTVKVDLHDANVIRAALVERKDRLEKIVTQGQTDFTDHERNTAGAEAMDLERIIRLNFPG